MTSRGHRRQPPTLYIEEWMETIPGLTRKDLAERMGVSPSAVTKKLKEPWRIDQEWLALFAYGLGREDVRDLYRHPDQPTPKGLLDGLNDAQFRDVSTYVSFIRQKDQS